MARWSGKSRGSQILAQTEKRHRAMCEPEGRPNERDVAGGGFILPGGARPARPISIGRVRPVPQPGAAPDSRARGTGQTVRRRASTSWWLPAMLYSCIVRHLLRWTSSRKTFLWTSCTRTMIFVSSTSRRAWGFTPAPGHPDGTLVNGVVVSLWDAFCRRRHVSAGYCAQNRSHDFRPVGGCQKRCGTLVAGRAVP